MRPLIIANVRFFSFVYCSEGDSGRAVGFVPTGCHESQITSATSDPSGLVRKYIKSGHPRASLKTAARGTKVNKSRSPNRFSRLRNLHTGVSPARGHSARALFGEISRIIMQMRLEIVTIACQCLAEFEREYRSCNLPELTFIAMLGHVSWIFLLFWSLDTNI